MEVDLEDVDLRELLVTVTDTHRISIKKKELTLSLNMSPPGPPLSIPTGPSWSRS